jgi:hypothetical protein
MGLLYPNPAPAFTLDQFLVEIERLKKERDEARARAIEVEQRLLDAECERDACRGMELAAEKRAERLFRDRSTVDERARRAAEALIAVVGANGPMNVDEVATRAVKRIEELETERDEARAEVEVANRHTQGLARSLGAACEERDALRAEVTKLRAVADAARSLTSWDWRHLLADENAWLDVAADVDLLEDALKALDGGKT